MAPKARGLPSSSASTAKPPKTSSAAKIALEERWRPMVIESTDGLSSADFAGLVGLEELNPADFDGELKIIRGGRGAKRASANEEPPAKKKKKKQQQKSRKISASISEATTVDLNASDEEDAEEDQISATDKLLAFSSKADPSWSVEALPAKPSVPDLSSSVENDDDHVAPESVSCTSKLSDQWSSLGVPSHILTRLAALNLTVPTPIQVATIPSAISQDPATRMESIYGAAPTGSGKTLAFAIPMVAQIVAQKDCSSNSSVDPRRLRGLVLTPTRELAVQIKKHIEAITTSTSGNEGSSVRTALVVGGLAIQKQERILARQQPDIVVATPGRLWEIVSSGSVPFLDRSALQAVHFLVIDEADRMVEKGHFEELKQLIGLLNQAQSSSPSADLRQTYIFSATLMLAKKSSKRKLKHRKKSDDTPNLIELLRLDQSRLLVVDLTEGGRKSTPAAEGRLQEQIIHCLKEEKDVYLYYFLLEQQQNSILNTSSKSIVFANSIDCLRRLLNLLRFLGLSPLVVHSSMPQKRRLTAIERFTSNENSNSILLATDVAARGLDIPSVAAVIHYQCPRSAEIYVHRSGRTARGGRATGRSLILCDPAEEAFFLRDFCRILGKNSSSAGGKSDLAEYPVNSKALRRCKERVRLATLCDSLEHGLRKERSQLGWFKEAARAAEMDDSEEEKGKDQEEEEMDAAVGHGKATQTSSLVNGRKLKAYERQLKALLRCSIVFPS